MKKTLLISIICLTTSVAFSKSTNINKSNQDFLNDNYSLQKSTSKQEIIKSKTPTTEGLCDNPSSGCYSGWLGGCLYISGAVLYCIRH